MAQSSMLPAVAAHPPRPRGPVAPARILRSPGGLLLAGLIWLLAFVALYFPAAQAADLGPLPDATEYATTADRLAHFHSFAIELLGRTYPPRYPFGFPLLLVPSYWLPGATLANGIYAVIAFSACTVVFSYALALLIAGRVAGFAAAATVLLLPYFIIYTHLLMSETASAMLVAVAALLVYFVAGAEGPRLRRGLGALGLVCGLAVLIHLPNILVAVAALAALLALDRVRADMLRNGAAFLAGPALALIALAVYDFITFGGVFANGYRYWAPEWYSSLGSTFSLNFAFHHPGRTGDYGVPLGVPNALFYLESLTGSLPTSWGALLPRGFALLAGAGALILAIDRRPASRAVFCFAAVLSLLWYGFYALYYYQTVRFLLPLAPVVALCCGIAVARGLRLLAGGLRSLARARGAPATRFRVGIRSVPQLAAGGAICALTGVLLHDGLRMSLVSLGVQPPAVQMYPLRSLTHAVFAAPVSAPTAASYRMVVRAGSIILTDTPLPFLDADGVSRANTIVPFTRGEYWDEAPLRATQIFSQRLSFIAAALRRGTPIYTDANGITLLYAQLSNPATLRYLPPFHLAPLSAHTPITIYLWVGRHV